MSLPILCNSKVSHTKYQPLWTVLKYGQGELLWIVSLTDINYSNLFHLYCPLSRGDFVVKNFPVKPTWNLKVVLFAEN